MFVQESLITGIYLGKINLAAMHILLREWEKDASWSWLKGSPHALKLHKRRVEGSG